MATYNSYNQNSNSTELAGGRAGGVSVDLNRSTPQEEVPTPSSPPINAESLTGNVKFLRRIYSNNEFKKRVTTEFSELRDSSNDIDLEAFFRTYDLVFFNIPKEGTNSHTSMITRSTDYVRNYIDPKDQTIRDLNARIEELERDLLGNTQENLLYKNGTLFIGPNNKLYYMDKGYRRHVVWDSNSFHASVKVALYGTTNPDLPILDETIFSNIPIGPEVTSRNFSEPFIPNEITDSISTLLLELDPIDIHLSPANYNNIDVFAAALEKDLEDKNAVIDALTNKVSSINNQINAIIASDPDYIPPPAENASGNSLPANDNVSRR